MIWVAVFIGVVFYAAAAIVSFGASTCAGQYVMWSDWVWAVIWPLFWLRPLGWKVRRWWTKKGLIHYKYDRWQIIGIPAQRIDRWLLHAGEDMSIRWANRN